MKNKVIVNPTPIPAGSPRAIEKILLSIEEVAELTGFSVGTLYHWVSEKRIPVVRLSSRCIRFRRSDLEAWIERVVVRQNGAKATANQQMFDGKTLSEF